MSGARNSEVRVQRGPGGCLISIAGTIDETFDRTAVAAAAADVLVIDVDGATRITSFGVREWTTALRSLSAAWVGFVKVRPALIAQFNMVSGFGGRGEIVSLYLPYVCPQCSATAEHLVDRRSDAAALRAFHVPPLACPSCGKAMELDDVPEAYLSFVAAAAPPAPPAAAAALIDGDSKAAAGAASGPTLRVEKEIDGTVTALWVSGPLDRKSALRRITDGLEGDVVVVLGGIGSVAPEGVEALAKLTALEGAPLLLARVPASLAAALVAQPAACGRARIASFRASLECTGCRAKSVVDLEAIDVELGAAAGFHRNCVSCWQPLELDRDMPPLDRLALLPLGQPSDALRDYLETHRDGPGRPDLTDDPDVWGRYRLGRQIGSGGMAQVFIARQVGPEGFEKKVVLKRMLPELCRDPRFVEMFIAEARLAARLSHPNIVQVFDFGTVGDRYYIAMELVRGWDLSAVLRVSKQLGETVPLPIACRIVSDLCAALAAAHRRVDEDGNPLAIVHRDVSPQNVLLSASGVTKLTDFGIAKATGSIELTGPGMVRGKMSYMAPEQLRGRELDGRADLWALGVVFFQILTGASPFERETQAESINAVLEGEIPDVRTLRPDAPESVTAILRRTLERELHGRWQDAQELRHAVETVLVELGSGAVSDERVAQWLGGLFSRADAAGNIEVPRAVSLTLAGNEITTALPLATGLVKPT